MRTFSTTQARPRQTPTHLQVPHDKVPDYPYGDFRTYKQRNVGLYDGAKIRFGNTVARVKNNNPKLTPKKAPTHWEPNRRTRRLWSKALGQFIRTRLVTRLLRTVDKVGGIDNYLLGNTTQRLRALGPAGWRLRYRIMQSPAIRERFAQQREALGLPPKVIVEDEVEEGRSRHRRRLESNRVEKGKKVKAQENLEPLERNTRACIARLKDGSFEIATSRRPVRERGLPGIAVLYLDGTRGLGRLGESR